MLDCSASACYLRCGLHESQSQILEQRKFRGDRHLWNAHVVASVLCSKIAVQHCPWNKLDTSGDDQLGSAVQFPRRLSLVPRHVDLPGLGTACRRHYCSHDSRRGHRSLGVLFKGDALNDGQICTRQRLKKKGGVVASNSRWCRRAASVSCMRRQGPARGTPKR